MIRSAAKVQSLFGLGHRTTEDHVFDLGAIKTSRALQRRIHHESGHIVWPRRS
jgi:hypothetical protein